MRSPEDIRARLKVKWRQQWTTWLGGGGKWPQSIPLAAPTEAEARRRWPQFQAWVRTWDAPEWRNLVVFESRSWHALGPQQVPASVQFPSAAAVAAMLGPEMARAFNAADARWADRAAAWPDLAEELRRHASWMAELTAADYARFCAAFDWLAEHPDSGVYIRQLPIAGLDSKWVERHQGAIGQLLACRRGIPPAPLHVIAGLRVDLPRRRMLVLDPRLRAHVGGLRDISLPMSELAELALPIRVALIVENQQTALAFTDLPGAVVLVGGGFSASEFGQVPWLHRVPVLYWGDIDTAGFAILSGLRSTLPHAVSCLMDERTLLAHKDVWSHDPTQNGAVLTNLTEAERLVYQGLLDARWDSALRLEQERIAWDYAWSRIVQTADQIMDGSPCTTDLKKVAHGT